jgi:hypothetical protein
MIDALISGDALVLCLGHSLKRKITDVILVARRASFPVGTAFEMFSKRRLQFRVLL